MGHSEMLLAVAGLKPEEIKVRTKDLAEGNWGTFPPSERIAFQFAYKLSKEPSKVTNKEVKELIEAFGDHRAIDIIWYISWCNYMTRVADAFQLQLEPNNVFERPKEKKENPEKEKKDQPEKK